MNKNKHDKILLGHGSGGRLTHELIEGLFKGKFDNPALNLLGDSAVLDIEGVDFSRALAFTTDSFVIKPVFFPGGDIGKLAVCGTVNDLAVSGAKPMFISAAAIIEEGFPMADLERIADSMKKTAEEAGVKIVTGDTKVVEKGSADGIFINTSGIGIMHPKAAPGFSADNIKHGDSVIINGNLADHGLAVLKAREQFDFKYNIESDCAPLSGVINSLIESGIGIKFMRDPTRGGLAATLNEITCGGSAGILLDEKNIPVSADARAVCSLLGLDPLYIANEGKFILICENNDAEKAVSIMKSNPLGKNASIIGKVTDEYPGKVILKTAAGGARIIDMPVADQLPRIC